jgi:ribosome biogenesis GTPase
MEKGTVIKSTGSWYTIQTESGRICKCKIRGNYRILGIRATNPVTVGDKVSISISEDSDSGVIEKISERNNYMIRKSSNLSKEYQLIAANIDQAWIMASLSQPRTYLEFIDRFLVTAEAYRISVSVIYNKTDIYNQKMISELKSLEKLYLNIGYKFYSISVKTGMNLDEIKSNLIGKTTLISGNSGVGKSTLINTLFPEVSLKTGDISESHGTGKHTTTFAEMLDMGNGTKIIDTPGIRGFGVVDFDKEEIFHFFPEIFRISKECQFTNCLHVREPGCKVISAVEKADIALSRYQSYLSILDTNDSKYR